MQNALFTHRLHINNWPVLVLVLHFLIPTLKQFLLGYLCMCVSTCVCVIEGKVLLCPLPGSCDPPACDS